MSNRNGHYPPLSIKQALAQAARVERENAAAYKRELKIEEGSRGEIFEKESRLANVRRLIKTPITIAQLQAIVEDCEKRLADGPGPRRTKGKAEWNETPTEYAYRSSQFYRCTTTFKIAAQAELARRIAEGQDG